MIKSKAVVEAVSDRDCFYDPTNDNDNDEQQQQRLESLRLERSENDDQGTQQQARGQSEARWVGGRKPATMNNKKKNTGTKDIAGPGTGLSVNEVKEGVT
jgi:hypothetical protein